MGVPRYVCKFGFLCNINGKVTWLLSKGNFKIKMAKDQSFLKLLQTNHFGFVIFFGFLSSNNDINVLDRSPFITNLLQGPAQDMDFVVNGNTYPKYYLCANGNYFQWSIFVQTIHEPQGKKRQHFSKMQEGAKKDMECCFWVLQTRFAIIQNLNKKWDMANIKSILIGCDVILHNLIIKDESNCNLEHLFDVGSNVSHLKQGLFFENHFQRTTQIENVVTRYNLEK